MECVESEPLRRRRSARPRALDLDSCCFKSAAKLGPALKEGQIDRDCLHLHAETLLESSTVTLPAVTLAAPIEGPAD